MECSANERRMIDRFPNEEARIELIKDKIREKKIGDSNEDRITLLSISNYSSSTNNPLRTKNPFNTCKAHKPVGKHE